MKNDVKVVLTNDGSHTLYSNLANAHYHSLNGAVQESQHIFIENGLYAIESTKIRILEVGFGTGLNATLTAYHALKNKQKVFYQGIDNFPLSQEVLKSLNYTTYLPAEIGEMWEKISACEWDKPTAINDFFTITKRNVDFISMEIDSSIDLVYFDAFAPDDQMEMWTLENFKKLYDATSKNGIIVTYCSKGIVKQALRQAGYNTQRLPGPPGKRHMIRGIKG